LRASRNSSAAARIVLYRLLAAMARANRLGAASPICTLNLGRKIMKLIPLAAIAALSACNAAAPTPKTAATTVASPHISLASYRTFSFGLSDPPKVGYEVTPRSLEVQRRLRSVVLAELQQRGYTADDAQGDLIVKLAAGTGPELLRDAEKGAERATPSGLARGFIGIDIYDGSTGVEVWQGSAFAEIDPAKIDDSLLEMGVSHMLKDFPTRAAAVATAHN
jgi:hypothetical protein